MEANGGGVSAVLDEIWERRFVVVLFYKIPFLLIVSLLNCIYILSTAIRFAQAQKRK